MIYIDELMIKSNMDIKVGMTVWKYLLLVTKLTKYLPLIYFRSTTMKHHLSKYLLIVIKLTKYYFYVKINHSTQNTGSSQTTPEQITILVWKGHALAIYLFFVSFWTGNTSE